MQAESNVRPSMPFEIEEHNGIATIRFHQNVERVDRLDEESGQAVEAWVCNEYILQVPARPGLTEQVDAHYDAWLQLAIERENEPRSETNREKVFRMDRESRLLGVELSEREIQEIMLGRQISDLEIQLIELQLGGM